MTEETRQFSVRLSYDTHAQTPEAAIEMALSRVEDRSGFYVEVFSERSPDTTEIEGDISEFPEPNREGPVPEGLTVTLRFRPQAWQNDYAVPVDCEGRETWQVSKSAFLSLFPDEQAFNDEHDDRDNLRFDGDAPVWVRDWSGPFEVELADDQHPWDDAG